jgi:hypothetical protein
MCEIDKEDRNRGDMWLRDSVEKREWVREIWGRKIDKRPLIKEIGKEGGSKKRFWHLTEPGRQGVGKGENRKGIKKEGWKITRCSQQKIASTAACSCDRQKQTYIHTIPPLL